METPKTGNENMEQKEKTSNENIRRFDFSLDYGSCDSDMVALFDNRDLSEQEAQNIIHQYPMGYDHRVVFMTKKQFETVFRSLQKEER